MTVSSIAVTDAASPDKYIHTEQRTISSTAREDQYFQAGQPAYPTYMIRADGVSVATNGEHLLQIMGDGTNYSRLVRYRYEIPSDLPASGATIQIGLVRLSTAGTGGTAVNDQPYDSADSYSGDMRTLPTSKGTESATLHRWWPHFPAAIPADPFTIFEWTPPPYGKPIVFGTATTDGIAFKVISGVASADIAIHAEIITTSYL